MSKQRKLRVHVWHGDSTSVYLHSVHPDDGQFLLRRKADAEHTGDSPRWMQDLTGAAAPGPRRPLQFRYHAECPFPSRRAHRVWPPAPHHQKTFGPRGERHSGPGKPGGHLHQTSVPEQSLLEWAEPGGLTVQPNALQTGEGRCCPDFWHREVPTR